MTTRNTTKVALPNLGIGSENYIIFHRYGPQNCGHKVYIQASLHADELPGLLVAHHLINLLEVADKKGLIAREITIVPYANPIGLTQNFAGAHLGRFSAQSGTNFNRQFENVAEALIPRLEEKLHLTDQLENVRLVRAAFKEELDSRYSTERDPHQVEEVLKYQLLREACDADIVLDLHCDSDSIMHLYTHERMWPQMADLAALLGSECNLTDAGSGGDCFDESTSMPWMKLADHFHKYPIPLACQAVTVELRGQYDVNDISARADAVALYQFLLGRGYILPDVSPTSTPAVANCDVSLPRLPSPFPALKRKATPLTGVDMIKISAAGVLSWKVKAGEEVVEGQVVGEIVKIEDPFAPRIPIQSRTAGLVFSIEAHKLAIPGQVVIKVAGEGPLPWRKGNLLTSR